jgi:hypothetical protein
MPPVLKASPGGFILTLEKWDNICYYSDLRKLVKLIAWPFAE